MNKNCKIKTISIILFLSFLIFSQILVDKVYAGDIAVTPIADITIHPGDNVYSPDAEYLEGGNMDGEYPLTAAIKFDISEVDGTVTNAALKIFITSYSKDTTFNVYGTSDDAWVEQAGNLVLKPTVLLAENISVTSADAYQFKTISLSNLSYFDNKLDKSKVTILIKEGTGGSADSFEFFSSEYSYDVFEPELSISYVTSPIVTTNPTITSITSNSATVNGKVVSDGGVPVTERGVEYKKSSDPESNYVKKVESGTSVGDYSVNLTGLESGTSYDVRAYATNSMGTSYGDVVQFTTENKTLSIAHDQPMTESNLDDRYIDAALSGDTFKDNTLAPDNFTLNNAPSGLTIESVTYTDSTNCRINLAYDGTDFDSNITNLGVTIKGAELTGSTDLTASENLTITATNDPESITISDDGNIIEGSEDGEKITINLTGGTFAAEINPTNWTITGLPTGVSRGAVTRVNATTVEITLTGNRTVGYDTNISNVQVTCQISEYKDSTGGAELSANSGVTLIAAYAPTVTTNNPATSITPTSATVSGVVTSDGGAVLSERGIEYKKSGDSYLSVSEGGTSTGDYSVNLSGLSPSTTYYVRAYATNSDGTSYGAVVSFTTTNTDPTISDIEDKTTNEDTSITNISFTIDDAETPAASLIVSATSDNLTLIPNDAYSFGGSGTDRVLTITPALNKYGTANVLVTVSDGSGGIAQDIFKITVNPVNDAPQLLEFTGTFNIINEDDITNIGNPIFTIAGPTMDAELDDMGIAITSTTITTGNGNWQYSTDGGTSWKDIGVVSEDSALLLNITSMVRFVPDGKNGANGFITYRAWDKTSGTQGDKVDTTQNGGTSAFSTDTNTANINVMFVNDAPVLEAVNPSLATIVADEVNNSGQTVESFIGASISDVDSGALEGIAITSTTSENGTWQYSIDNGSTWTAIGAVAGNSALLLGDTDKVRFVPNGQDSTTASITYRACDKVLGSEGTKVDTSTNGGVTAFSTAIDTASIKVNEANYAPVLTASAPSLAEITEDDTSNEGQTIASIVGTSITDANTSPAPVEGIAIVSVANGNGIWEYSIDNGGTWSSIGAVADNSALLLIDTDRVRFIPNGQNETTASITYRAWDRTTGTRGTKVNTTINGGKSAFSTATDTANINVTAVNDAPVLAAATPSLTTIVASDTENSGHTVSSIVGTTISDIDSGAQQGIAIKATTNGGSGKWQYSIDDGSNWTDVDSVSNTSALLLRSIDKIRFVPDGQNGTTALITYSAWDQTLGTEGSKENASNVGGATPFSTSTNTASITVTETIKPTLINAVRTDNTHIIVQLSENCTNITKANDGGFIVNETGKPGVAYTVTAIAQGSDASYVVLTVQDMAISAKEGVTITYTAGGNGTIQDSIGNSMATDGIGVTVAGWDTTEPTINSSSLSANNAYVDITFSEGIYGANDGITALTASKFALTFTKNTGTSTGVVISSIKKNDNTAEGSASALTGGETTVRVFLIVSGTPNGAETIEINPANGTSIYDVAGNAVLITQTTGVKALKDKLAPTVQTVTVPANGTYKSGDNLDFTVNYSEEVTVVGTPQIALTLGSVTKAATYISGSGSTTLVFRYTVQEGDNDSDGVTVNGLQLNGGTIKDIAENNAALTLNSIGSTTEVKVDTTAPTVQTVTVPSNGIYKLGDNLDFTVNYSEAITVTGTPQIALTLGSVTRTANYISGSGSTAIVFRYVLKAGDNDSDGITVNGLEINGGTIKDSAANNASLTLNSVASTAEVKVDAVAPIISSVIVPASDTYILGENLDFTVNYSEKVTVTGTPQLSLTLGSVTRKAIYSSGSGTTALVFRYTVQVGDSDNDGIAINSLELNGGTIRDSIGNDATLTLNGVGATSGIKVDTTAPTFNPATGTAIDSTFKIVTLTFSENIVNALVDINSLKNAVTFAANGINYNALGTNDTVSIINNKLVITFENALIGNSSKIQIAGNSLKDEAGNKLADLITTNAIIVSTVPEAPTGVSATAGNGSAVISFTAPVDNGGSPITGYKVTSTPGNIIATGNGSPITITGLTNGTSYIFTVTATNAIGTSTASAASNGVTPIAPYIPPSGGGSQPNTEPKQEQITVNVTDGTNNNVLSGTTIQRTTETDGTKKDAVQYTADKAQETVEKLKEAGKDTARLVIPDEKDEVAEAEIKIPTTTLSIIAQGNINLQIDTENARISLPKDSIKNLDEDLKQDLFFRVVPIKEEDQRKEIVERAKQEAIVKQAIRGSGISVVGRPMTIETNMSQRSVDIVLPLKGVTIPSDPKAREEFFSKIGIFIEHSDGEKALTKGEVVEYKNGVFGVKFTIKKFSTFTIIKLNEGEFDEDLNISSNGGFGGPKTFMPDKKITITFNKDLNESTLTKDSIYVEDSKGNKVEAVLKYNATGKTVTVTPSKYYNTGETYYLCVTDKLLSTSGKSITKKIRYSFNISNVK